MAFSSKPRAWIYPGLPAQNALIELQDGRKMFAVSIESHTINTSGVVTTTGTGLANEATTANLAICKANSKEVFITVSGNYANANLLLNNATNSANAITTLVNFVNTNNLQGVDIDFEQYKLWTVAHNNLFLAWITNLANELHKYGKKLQVDLPAIWNATFQAEYPNVKYEDYESLPVDIISCMLYDYMYDFGGGSSVQPLTWATDTATWINARITDKNRISLGLPSYGYSDVIGDYTPAIRTKAQTALISGYNTVTNATQDGERFFSSGGQVHFYQTSSGMNTKRLNLETSLARNVTVWHLGGNDWFDNVAQPETFDQPATLSVAVTGTPNPVSVGSVVTFAVAITNTGTRTAYQLKLTPTIPTAYSTVQYSYNNIDWFNYTTAVDVPAVDQSSSYTMRFRATAQTQGSYTPSFSLSGGNITTTSYSTTNTVGTGVVVTGAKTVLRNGLILKRNGTNVQKAN